LIPGTFTGKNGEQKNGSTVYQRLRAILQASVCNINSKGFNYQRDIYKHRNAGMYALLVAVIAEAINYRVKIVRISQRLFA
jgi:hypothetical protein